MKKIIAGILSFVTVGVLVAGAVYHADDIKGWFHKPETQKEEVWGDFVSQFNHTNAPSVSVGLDVSKETPALTFTARTGDDSAEAVFNSENYTYGMLVAPLSDFEKLNTKKVNEFDWKTAFDSAKIEPVVDITFEKDSEYVKVGAMQDQWGNSLTTFGVSVPIEYGYHNTQYASVMYKKEVNEDGFVRYLYGSATTRINGASALYYATQSLAYAQGCDEDVGVVTYTDAELKAFNKIVNDAVDYANGLEKPTDDNSQFKFTTNLPPRTEFEGGTGAIILELNQFYAGENDMEDCFKVTVDIEHDLDVFVAFRDAEPDLWIIYFDGTIDQFNTSGALCMGYVGGQYFEFNVIINPVETSETSVE